MITIKTTTWGCVCGYSVDGNLFENKDYFSHLFPFVPYGTCPSCRNEQLARIIQPDLLSTHQTVEQADIDALTVPEFNPDGSPVMVASGQTKPQLAVVDGNPTVVDTAAMVQQERPLTNAEKQEKLAQAQQSVDALSTQEFNPNQVG